MFILVLSLGGAFSLRGLAQPSTTTRIDSTARSSLRIGVRYASDYYFMGRADSSAAPFLSPSVTYYHTSGIFVRSSMSYLTSSEESRIDAISFSAGYDFYRTNFAMGTSLGWYGFSDLSYLVVAEMNWYANAYAAYDFGPVMLYADVGLGISSSTDFFTSIELSRTFYLVQDALQITPAVTMNAGSQHYYDQYYSERSVQTGSGYGHGKGSHQPPPATTSLYTLESTVFQILDYEADLLVSYRIKNFKVFTSATWLFPVNPATIMADTGTYTEELKNGFYWTAGLRYYIHFKKS
jgi:hypothetical protein